MRLPISIVNKDGNYYLSLFPKKNEQKSVQVEKLLQYENGIYWIGLPTKNRVNRTYSAVYCGCDTVFSCVNLIAQSAIRVPWYVYRHVGKNLEEVDNHALVNWIKKPGIDLDWQDFMRSALSYFLISGNTFIRKNVGDGKQFGIVEVLGSQYTAINLNTDRTIRNYEYRLSNVHYTLAPDDVIHIKKFNPELTTAYGLSTIESISKLVEVSLAGLDWTANLLQNEARPSGALIVKTNLSEEQRNKLEELVAQKYAGAVNAGRPMILGGEWDWKSFSITPKELELLRSDRVLMRKICAAYNVPPELLGDSENKTYSNQKEARKALYQEAALPALEIMKNSLNRSIVRDFTEEGDGIFLDYDPSGIDALSEDLDSLWTRVNTAKQSGIITRNEAREELGYGTLPGPDILTDSISMVPTPVGKPSVSAAEWWEGEGAESTPGKKPSDGGGSRHKPRAPKSRLISVKGGFWQKAERKEAKWNAFNRRIQARQRGLEPIAGKYLLEQGNRIVKVVKKAPSLNMIDKWLIMDKEKEAGLFVDASLPWYVDSFKRAISSGMAAGKGEIFEGEAKETIFTPEHEKQLRKMILESGTKISETTMLEVMDMLELAEANNWTVDDLAQAIHEEVYKRERWKSRRIAMTEAAKIENYGELEGYRQTEFVELKGWLCSFLEHSREAHMKADADYSDNPIVLDDPFNVGGESMMQPLDDSMGASASNIINCKCTIFPQVREV